MTSTIWTESLNHDQTLANQCCFTLACQICHSGELRRIYAAAYTFSEDGKTVVDLFPAMNVVPITFSRDEYLVSCDKLNLRLHIFRAILPPGTMITVQNAARAEREQLRSKRATKNGGLWTLVREKRKAVFDYI